MHRRTVSIIMLTLVSLGLFSSLAGLSSEQIPMVSNQAATSPVSDYENATTHEGDLIVNGTKTFAIENCTFIQSGNVYVKDHAKLKVYNVILNLSTENTDRRIFWVQDHAELEMRNANISGYCPMTVTDHAKATITNSRMLSYGMGCSGDSSVEVNNSIVSEIGISSNSEVRIENGNVDTVNLNVASGDIVSLSNLLPGFFSFWNLHESQPLFNVAYDLTLTNTRINDWEGWWVRVDYRSKATILNSTLNLGIDYSQTTAEIRDITVGFHRNWTNGMITLENCRLGLIESHLNDVSLTVVNSTIFLFATGLTNISASQSGIDHLAYENAFGTLHAKNTTFAWTRFINSNLFLSGEVIPMKQADSWVLSNVTRNYVIETSGKGDNPIESVEITLLDQNDEEVWIGSTDNLGRVDFNITFSDSNYTDWSRLGVYKEGFYNVAKNVGFLSSTPIAIPFVEKPLGDINEDHKVNIIDVSLVAYSFGCVPADRRWKAECDLNNDNIINIVDVSLVAKNYRKAV